MSDNTQEPQSQGLPTKPKLTGKLPWLNWVLLGVFAVVVVGIVYGGRILLWGRGVYAGTLAGKAETLMEQEEWMGAAEALRDARSMQGDQNGVLRAQARFLQKTKIDPVLLQQTLELLIERGKEEPGDRLEVARLYLANGELKEAQRWLDSLPPEVRDGPEGLKLLAGIQMIEGQSTNATKTMKKALYVDASAPESGVRLALLNSENTFPEIQKQAVDKLWSYAERDDKVGMEALGYLINRKDLKLEQAEKLLVLVEKHPEAEPRHRFIVLSAILRLDPTRREKIYDEETAKFEGKGEGVEDLVPILSWLAQEKQHSRILKLVPMKVASKSREVFPLVAQALIEGERWDELKVLLLETEEVPLPKPLVDLWLAEAYSHLEPDMIESQQRLRAVFEAGKRDQSQGMLVAAARLADKTKQWKLSLEIYDELAALNPRMRAPMMEQALKQARGQNDPEVMLSAAKRLFEARPENAEQRDQMDFLRLVLGEEIELVDLSKTILASEGQAADRAAILAALMAFRLWLPDEMVLNLKKVADVKSLKPGWRAIYAGLMAEADNPAKAFAIAERVPEALLIDEEVYFLNLAK